MTDSYYTFKEKILIYHGDMLEVLPSLDRTFMHCITDPPYGVQRKSNFQNMGRTGLTFGEWDEHEDVVHLLPAWIECMCKMTKDNMVIFNDWHNMSLISQCLNEHDFTEKELVLWKKTNPMPRNCDRRFVPCLEYALWATKRVTNWTFNVSNGNSYELPIIECPRERNDDFNDHTTSKPLKLMEKLVSLFTNENDWILDPFGGSGTIAIACYKLHRNIVLIEKDEHYCEIMAKRIENTTRQLYLF